MSDGQITQVSGAEAPVAEQAGRRAGARISGPLSAPASSTQAHERATSPPQGGGVTSSPAPSPKSSRERHAELAVAAYRLGYESGLATGLEHATDQIRATRVALKGA